MCASRYQEAHIAQAAHASSDDQSLVQIASVHSAQHILALQQARGSVYFANKRIRQVAARQASHDACREAEAGPGALAAARQAGAEVDWYA